MAAAAKDIIPPAALYIRDDILPANTAPINIRTIKIMPASFHPRYIIETRVTILASPSFIPGTETRGGICASTIKIVRAIAVSIAIIINFFDFKL